MTLHHDHHHGCGHNHSHGSGERNLTWAFIITLVYMIAEAAGGFWFNSLALLADAGHMFSDAAALGLSWMAMRIGRRPATDSHTFGFRRSEILAAFLNGIALWAITGVIIYEAIRRFFTPEPVVAGGMLVIAGIGLLVNLVLAATLFSKRSENLNLRSAFLHVLSDALGSVGAMAAAVIILYTQAYWVDPLVSLFVGGLILLSSWSLVKQSAHILMEGVPHGVDVRRIEESILDQDGVCCVHDLHVWTIAGDRHALAAHVVIMDPNGNRDTVLGAIQSRLGDEFGIEHTTIQLDIEHDACGTANAFCRPGVQCKPLRT